VFLAHLDLRVQRVSLEMLEKLVQEEEEEQWVLLAEMAKEVEQVEMENVEEVVHLEPKESKVTLECQDYPDQKDITVSQVFLENLVLMDLLESLERMALRVNLVLKVTWDHVGF
jgi:SepF-like predicted cell division protein (DUF552 family)